MKRVVIQNADKKALLKRAMKVALEMQDRFAAEPIFSKTGKGYLKSEGVAPLAAIKKEMKRERI